MRSFPRDSCEAVPGSPVRFLSSRIVSPLAPLRRSNLVQFFLFFFFPYYLALGRPSRLSLAANSRRARIARLICCGKIIYRGTRPRGEDINASEIQTRDIDAQLTLSHTRVDKIDTESERRQPARDRQPSDFNRYRPQIMHCQINTGRRPLNHSSLSRRRLVRATRHAFQEKGESYFIAFFLSIVPCDEFIFGVQYNVIDSRYNNGKFVTG